MLHITLVEELSLAVRFIQNSVQFSWRGIIKRRFAKSVLGPICSLGAHYLARAKKLDLRSL